MPDAALAATQTMPFAIGSVLGERYEILALLGEGGMGTVFRAHDRELDEHVALKVLHVEAASDKATLTRFRREVKLARRVTHRNVARTFDLGFHRAENGAAVRFLTMELIEGQSLAARAAASAIALPDVLRIAAEIARGLAAAHVVGVVHRDLKPDNVMLSEDRVVITDFGIARVADGAGDVMRTGMIVGTPAYMAPEQLENGTIDGRTDVYALGTILFELLTRSLPFKGDSPVSIAAQRITTDAPDVRSREPSVPEAVAVLVGEMLARRRESRPDVQSVLDRVEGLRGNAAGVRRGAVRVPVLTSDSIAVLGQARTVVVEPLTGGPPDLGPVLERAIVDHLNEARVARVSLGGRGVSGDVTVQGTVHASGDRVRVRIRLVGGNGTALWTGHIDGSAASSLDLEDEVIRCVGEAVRARMSAKPLPADPSLREAYEAAQRDVERFALPHVMAAIGALEQIERTKPGDPQVRTLLAKALLMMWSQTGARDHGVIARVEDLALRALQDDPSLSDAYNVIAYLRLEEGEFAAAIRAAEECLRIDPRNSQAHAMIGDLLCESLYVSEGRRRLELATRLAPDDPSAIFGRIEVAAMLDDRAQVQSLLAEMATRSGPLSTVFAKIRLASWWDDREMALECADMIDRARTGAAWESATHALRALATHQIDAETKPLLANVTTNDVSPRHRSMLHEIGADFFARLGDPELALEHVVSAARLPFTNLLWLDRSPPLEVVRGDPRFAEARATTAARVAALWGSVGTLDG